VVIFRLASVPEDDLMATKNILLLHPGNMGATIGACAASRGDQVSWLSVDRSPASRARAEKAGLVEAKEFAAVLKQSDIVLSICPPDAALDVATQVAAEKFTGIYVDANAVSRATAEAIGKVVNASGASFVDGGIIGSPVKQAGTTRLYLSGTKAEEIAKVFTGSLLDARAIGVVPGEASALKVAYAAWTKGTDALILAIRALAAHEGVEAALLEEWRLSQPVLEKKCLQAAASAAPKMWRYVGEMKEIAAAFENAGLPGGFHHAAAEVCGRLAVFKDRTEPPLSVATVLERLKPLA
jgi:3-hydroxyisobutyrate dehydrogenase-like beta-hydroxyacid dehydrogenase